MERQTVTFIDFKLAMQAHNAGKREASFNENFNKANKLGSLSARNICYQIANSKCGNKLAKITLKDAISWAQSMLPAGMGGYPSQEIKPYFEQLVTDLKAKDCLTTKGGGNNV
jgi:hypothetical protein